MKIDGVELSEEQVEEFKEAFAEFVFTPSESRARPALPLSKSVSPSIMQILL